jgi:hypothetical protein
MSILSSNRFTKNKKSIFAVSALTLALAGCGGDSKEVVNVLTKIPANTSVVYSASLNANIMEQAGTFANNMRTNQLTIQQIASSMLNEESAALVNSMFANSIDSLMMGKKIFAAMGTEEGVSTVAYLDGLEFVARMPITNPEAWWTYVDSLIGAGDTTEYVSGKYREVKLFNKDNEAAFSIFFTDAEGEGAIIIDFVNEGLSRVAQIMKGVEPKNSLEASGKMAALQKKYGFSSALTGYADIQQIVTDIYLGKSSQLVRDIATLEPEFAEEIKAAEFKACEADVKALVSGVPRFVFGVDNLSTQAGIIKQSGKFVLELTDADVKKALTKMDGYVPAYSLNNHGQALSLAYGSNVAGLAPALTTLWSKFTAKDYTCEALQEAKNEALQNSPAMLAMGTAMVQNIKGAGFSLLDFNVKQDDSSPMPIVELDAVVTIEGTNMASTAAMLPMIPQLAGIELVSGAEAVELPPLIPMFSQPIFAKMNDNHIVVYTGEKSKGVADKTLGENVLMNNGHFGATFNTAKIAGIATTLFTQAKGFGATMSFDADDCAQVEVMLNTLNSQDSTSTSLAHFSDAGWQVEFDTTMKATSYKAFHMAAGEFSGESLGYGCNWESQGDISLKADGSGSMGEDAITWSYDNNLISMTMNEESMNCLIVSQNNEATVCAISEEFGQSELVRLTNK